MVGTSTRQRASSARPQRGLREGSARARRMLGACSARRGRRVSLLGRRGERRGVRRGAEHGSLLHAENAEVAVEDPRELGVVDLA